MVETAVVLVGGRGLRLMPFTQDAPKPMVAVDGKPLVHWIIDWLMENGIKRIVFGCDYKKEALIDYVDKQNFDCKIEYNDHHGAEGTGDAFRLAIKNKKVNDKTFFAMNGDELTDLSIKNMLTFHKENEGIATLVATPLRSPYGVLEIDHDFNIKAFREKPVIDSHFINAGMYLFNKEIVKYLPKKGPIETSTFVKLASMNKLKAFKYYGFWRTVDSLKDLESVEKQVKVLRG